MARVFVAAIAAAGSPLFFLLGLGYGDVEVASTRLPTSASIYLRTATYFS